MKFLLILNYLLLVAWPVTWLLQRFEVRGDWFELATALLAIYQLLLAFCIAAHRSVYRKSFMIWYYWGGVLVFFFVALPNCKAFPWYFAAALAIYFTYVMHWETKEHYRNENN